MCRADLTAVGLSDDGPIHVPSMRNHGEPPTSRAILGGLPTPYTVRWHANAAAIDDFLWARSFTPPDEGRWWYLALETAGLEDQFTFRYGEIFDPTGTAIGIVPAFVMDVPMDLVAPPAVMRLIRAAGPLGRSFRTQRTLFIGNVAGEGGSIGLLPGVELGDVIPAIHRAADALRREIAAKLIVWKDFSHVAAAAISEPLGQAGYFRMISYPATRLNVPSGGIDGYLAALDGDYRYKLRKKLKQSRAALPLAIEVIRNPLPPVRQEIWRLFWQTFEHGQTKFERFTPAVFDRFAEHEGSRWLTLRDEKTGALLAFMLLTREGDSWVNRFIGMDYAAPRELFLYYRLFVEAIGFIATEPLPFLLSGQTGYRAKLELGHELLPLENFTRHRNPILHRVYAAIARGIKWRTLDPELATYLKAHPEADAG